MGNIGTWQLLIVLAIVLLLFGAKRLPEAARGLGRSLKIFKTETQGLVGGDEKADDTTASNTADQSGQETQSTQPARAVESTASTQQQSQTGEPVDDQSKRDA
ncbi:sec-independent protein translocase protein TatA [Haloactinopolyspora alba]|uniref:Sec-independent protein translocase protein TatA n=1 Tax=Haloactinopolyspora alba TaxID=648780 RepID=A0A2P8DYE7_9ACTN|nr:Sec-independent protein translocase subunit TatA [Haloactinopolyspora alba]PSL02212.1 sec-independent protein translocase protein TatA [Haloactinopolyspora alba]